VSTPQEEAKKIVVVNRNNDEICEAKQVAKNDIDAVDFTAASNSSTSTADTAGDDEFFFVPQKSSESVVSTEEKPKDSKDMSDLEAFMLGLGAVNDADTVGEGIVFTCVQLLWFRSILTVIFYLCR
jgi:hypothetical protein